MGFTDTSLIWRTAFFVTCIGFLLMIAGTASTYMAATELIPNMWMHLGMWDICDDTRSFSCTPLTDDLSAMGDSTDWLLGARAMTVMGLIVFGFIPYVSLYLTYAASSDQLSSLIIGVFNTVAGVFCSIGGIVFIVYGLDLLERKVEMDAYPSRSFIVYMLGLFCTFSSAIMNFYDACRQSV